MTLRSCVIGTAGHIDHGKTMLIKALTGIDTDRLPEEKRRGITIDLGFASMQMQTPDGSALQLSFVDVPGHSLFIRNMLAGAGCVDAVMLVISAEEGVKPQTVEHLVICQLLGIRQGITVITKADTVSSDRLQGIYESVRGFLQGTILDQDPVLPVSAKTGSGLDDLRQALLSLAVRSASRSLDAALRLPLDRAFVMKGFGTVVTGTLLSGAVQEGQRLTLEPGGRSVRVRGIQTHGEPAPSALFGSRVALNVSGVEVSDIARGQMLVSPQTLAAVETIDVEASLLEGVPELKHRARVHFHAFTAETTASVSLYGYEAASPGTTRRMRLKLTKPIVLVPGDRFVLRQSSPAMTIGGGRVLDAHPEPRLRKAAALTWLEHLERTSLPEQLVLRVGRRKTAGLRLDILAAETGLTPEAARRHVESALETRDLLLIPPDLFLSREAFDAAVSAVIGWLKASEKRADVKRSELRSQTGLSVGVFDFVLASLLREQQVQLHGEDISLVGSRNPHADQERVKLAAVSETYAAAGLAPPSVAELARQLALHEPEARRLVTLLQRSKDIVRMGSDDLFLHARALTKLIAQIRELRGQTMDVTQFKKLTGLSRKYAVPLLEYLDRERVTRRRGDQRLVL